MDFCFFVPVARKKCRLTRHWNSDNPGNLASQVNPTVNNLTTTALTGNAS